MMIQSSGLLGCTDCCCLQISVSESASGGSACCVLPQKSSTIKSKCCNKSSDFFSQCPCCSRNHSIPLTTYIEGVKPVDLTGLNIADDGFLFSSLDADFPILAEFKQIKKPPSQISLCVWLN